MGFDLQTWVRGHLQELHAVVQKTSSHLRLLGADSSPLGNTVFVRFAFDSKDAMGMNMATIATDAMVLFIEQQTGARCITISSNMCVDKKPNFLNFISGRGHKVWAEITIPKMAVKKVLKTSVDEFVYSSEKKLYQGSLLAGSIAGIVLAGEISLLASLAEGSLARAHRTLGRGEKV